MNAQALPALRPELSPVPQVLWLGDERASDSSLVGGKAANLSLLAERFRVPPGFAITLTGDTVDRAMRSVIADSYRRLGELLGTDDPPVAVRSSAVDEDGADASFAGQHDTYLNVSGADQVAWAVARCIASFHSERVLEYRHSRGLAPAPERVAVLVQFLVPADASGIVFSANPVTRDRDELLVNASFGLGESIVGGTVTPDAYVVERAGLALRERRVAQKALMTVPAPGGTREVPVPGRVARLAALRDEQARAAAQLALDLEEEMGWPVDIEVAWTGDELFLLQCRPITTL